MDEISIQSRISRIGTPWADLRRLQGDSADPAAEEAFVRVFRCYQVAVYRYLLACVRTPEAADEVFQEFAVRLWKGDFRKATPEKGRFRHYLKTALVRLARDHQRREQRRATRPLDEQQFQVPAAESTFDDCWRTELLDRVWQALAESDRRQGLAYHPVLALRAEQPDLSSEEFALHLSERLQRPITSANARKQLQRAREKFGELLIDETAQILGNSHLDAIEAELGELRLLPYCRGTLARLRRDAQSKP